MCVNIGLNVALIPAVQLLIEVTVVVMHTEVSFELLVERELRWLLLLVGLIDLDFAVFVSEVLHFVIRSYVIWQWF